MKEMEPEKLTRRDHSVDALRTIATLLVIVLHVSGGYVRLGMDSGNSGTGTFIANLIDSFSRICVPLFVMISGRFLLGRDQSVSEFNRKRLKRLAVPLIFWSIFYILYQAFFLHLEGSSLSFIFKKTLLSLIWGRPYYHLWYLFMLIGLYFLTPLLNLYYKAFDRKTVKSLAIAFLIIGVGLEIYDFYFGNKVLFLLLSIKYIGYFMLGDILKDYKVKGANKYPLILLYILSSFLIAVFSHLTIMHYQNLYFYNYLSPLVVISSISFYLFFTQLDLQKNLFSRIAKYSFGIYLIHAFVLDQVSQVINDQNLVVFQVLKGIFIEVVLVIILSLLLVKAMYRFPLLRKLI